MRQLSIQHNISESFNILCFIHVTAGCTTIKGISMIFFYYTAILFFTVLDFFHSNHISMLHYLHTISTTETNRTIKVSYCFTELRATIYLSACNFDSIEMFLQNSSAFTRTDIRHHNIDIYSEPAHFYYKIFIGMKVLAAVVYEYHLVVFATLSRVGLIESEWEMTR